MVDKMQKNNWTDEQLQAINQRNADILVAAAAGSGKTAVLVQRIINLITEGENPIDIDRLLVVTFTKAAAGEMCERIGEAIIKKLNEEPENTHLQKQITYLNRADIKTIDSFFLKTVKENYNIVNIDPSVRTADITETELLKAEVMEELFEELYESENNEQFLELVEIYGNGVRDTGLKDIIIKVYNFLQSNPYPKKWADEIIKDFNVNENMNIDDTKWGNLILKNIKFEIEGIIDDMKGALNIINSPNGPESYKNSVEKDYNSLLNFYNSIDNSFKSCVEAFKLVEFQSKIGSYRGDYKDIAQMVQNLRKNAIANFKKLYNKYFEADEKFSMRIISKLYPIISELIKIALVFTEKYNKQKYERMIIDFNDYGHMCIKILLDENSTINNVIPSKIATELQNKYDEILIDEYQDSNFIQEMVLSAISKKSKGENNRFLVGDVKQSIYRFRLAKPEIFMQKYESFDNSNNNNEKRIDLFKNFRSRENILYSINFIFKQLMTKDLGEINYDDRAMLYAGAKFLETNYNVGGSVELHIVEKKEQQNTENDVDLTDISVAETEAYFVARRIRELIDSNYMIFDKKINNYRKLEYRDITVLLRSKKNWTDAFTDVFEKELIPAYAEATTGYFDTVEIETIIEFLKIIDNPLQDIPFIAILRCPIFRFTSDELVNIKVLGSSNINNSIDNNFYNYALNYINLEDKNNITVRKLKKFFDILKRFRELSEYISVSELIKTIYNETNYFDYIGGVYGGKIKQANLLLLVEKAFDYENSSFKGLFNFIKYVEKVRKTDIDIGEASINSENDNIVRIMSIHKSKGLEFPVVFVAGIGKQFNKADVKDSLLLHQDLGIGADYIDFESRAKYSNITRYILAQEIDRENISEELRVLYVALTRAKEKLILIGSISNVAKKCISYITDVLGAGLTISSYKMLKANCYMDWIVPALVRHREGEKILNFAGTDINFYNYELYNDKSDWEIFFHNKSDIANDVKNYNCSLKNDNDINLKSFDIKNDYSGFRDDIINKMNWTYKNKTATLLPSNVSITEIKRNSYVGDYLENNLINSDLLVESIPEDFEFPDFDGSDKKEIPPKTKGTIIHTVMEKLDFKRQYNENDIKQFINELSNNNILQEQEAKLVINYPFIRFFNTDLAKRIQKSNKIFKEMPFALALTPFEIFKIDEYIGIDEDIMVHGVIDCYFYEYNNETGNDEIVLIDYKSDNVSVDEIKKRYSIQLHLYKIALERITDKKVKHCIIYSFSNNCEIYV